MTCDPELSLRAVVAPVSWPVLAGGRRVPTHFSPHRLEERQAPRAAEITTWGTRALCPVINCRSPPKLQNNPR